MDAALEIAVAAEHRHHVELLLLDRRLDFITGQWAAVADAGRAPVTDEVEAQLLEVGHQPGRLQVVGDHPRARRQAGLDRRRHFQPALDGPLGQQAGGHHHRRIRGVGTAGDGRDDDRAVADPLGRARHDRGPGPGAADRFRRPTLEVESGDIIIGWLVIDGKGRREALPDRRQRHPVLGALRARDARLDRAEVEFQQLGEHRGLRLIGAEHPLRPGVPFHQLDQFAVTPGRLQVAKGLGVDREEGRGGAVFRAHVGEGGAIRDRERGEAAAAELHELVDDAVLAQPFRQGQDQVGGGGPGPQRAGHPDAHHHRNRQVGGLAEQRGLGLDAADPPAEHPQPIDHGGMRVGAEQGVGKRVAALVVFADLDHPAQSLEVDLVTDAHPGWHHGEVMKRLLRPAQQGVALAVARVLTLDVARVGAQRTEGIHLDRVVDNEVDLDQRIDSTGVLPGALHRGSHGSQVDDRRYTGEILQQDARGQIRQLGVVRRGLGPAGQGPQAGVTHLAGLGLSQQAFEQDLDRHRQPVGVAHARGGQPR